ncbi:ribonuclease H-like domain-containing protein [Paraphysoderma sedebokerense]|nr:ribonuclease H-like domain-containing protein [Paraphysoderma sedebokerense]
MLEMESSSNWKALLKSGAVTKKVQKNNRSLAKKIIKRPRTPSENPTLNQPPPSKRARKSSAADRQSEVVSEDEEEDLLDRLDRYKSRSDESSSTDFFAALEDVLPANVKFDSSHLWFNYLDRKLGHHLKDKSRLGKYVALDCEMVGVGESGRYSALARVSIVNFHGQVLFDSYVRPQETITDYRTAVSGVTFKHIKDAPSLSEIQSKIVELVENRIVIGHALKHDLKVLLLSLPKTHIRDTSNFKPFRQFTLPGHSPSLKLLAEKVLGLKNFQSGIHDSVEDARISILLYRLYQKSWEGDIKGLTVSVQKNMNWAKRRKERKKGKN